MPMVMRHDEQYRREDSRSLRSIQHHMRYLVSTKMSCCPLQWNGYAALLNTHSQRKFDSALHPNQNYLCDFMLVPQYCKTKRSI